MQPFHTKSYLENNKDMRAVQHNQKKYPMCISMQSLKPLHTKETIYWTKGQNLLTSVDTKISSPFYGTIPRAKRIFRTTRTFLAEYFS